MTAIILRRRKLGRTSAREIARLSVEGIHTVRNWVPRDWTVLRDPETHPFVFRWGCTSELRGMSCVVVNTAETIHWCSDKKQGRLDMQAAGVPVPETWAVSDFWDHISGVTPTDRFVIRPASHAQGRNLECGTPTDLMRYMRTTLYLDGYISRLVEKVAEYRVFVCQGRVVWVAQKTPGNPEDVAWNVARGGRFDNVRWSDWNTKVLDAALKAAVVSGTDFCGVDVMVDADGNPFVLEVNSAPSQTSPYRQAAVAKAFDYIIREGKDHFPTVEWSERKTWKSYIHPAVRGNNEEVSSRS